MNDLMGENKPAGVPLKFDFAPFELDRGGTVRLPVPDLKDLVFKTLEVRENYDYALKLGTRSAERIRSRFLWSLTGRRLLEILLQEAKDI